MDGFDVGPDSRLLDGSRLGNGRLPELLCGTA